MKLSLLELVGPFLSVQRRLSVFQSGGVAGRTASTRSPGSVLRDQSCFSGHRGIFSRPSCPSVTGRAGREVVTVSSILFRGRVKITICPTVSVSCHSRSFVQPGNGSSGVTWCQ